MRDLLPAALAAGLLLVCWNHGRTQAPPAAPIRIDSAPAFLVPGKTYRMIRVGDTAPKRWVVEAVTPDGWFQARGLLGTDRDFGTAGLFWVNSTQVIEVLPVD